MRWTRIVPALMVVLLFVGVASFAQNYTPPPTAPEMAASTLLAFVVTWVSVVIAILSFAFMIRRDRIAQQERDELNIVKVVKRSVSDPDFKHNLDQRMIEIGRDLMFREFKVPETMAAMQQLSARVEALSRRVSDMPNEVQKTLSDAVANGVALGVTRAVEALDRERQKEMIRPDPRSNKR